MPETTVKYDVDLRETEANTGHALLRVNHLRVRFGDAEVVRDVSLTINAGESVGIIGESGSGKTMTALAMLGLLGRDADITADELQVVGTDVRHASPHEMQALRGDKAAMIFQDPITSLHPMKQVGRQLMEMIQAHSHMSSQEARTKSIALLSRVGIADAAQRFRDYPHEFSGGQSQRIVIAMGIACGPQLLIADEPTTALDVTIQAQILDLLLDLRSEIGTALLFITHDLGVIARVCERVVVMYGGRVVEDASATELFANPRHPYTVALLASTPRIDKPEQRVEPIDGYPLHPTEKPTGCAYRSRCSRAFDRCVERPPLFQIGAHHTSACWLGEGEDA